MRKRTLVLSSRYASDAIDVGSSSVMAPRRTSAGRRQRGMRPTTGRMSGRIALVSPVNLVHHDGVGPDATHHVDSDDTLFRLPRLEASVPATSADVRPLPVGADDPAYDRARVLLELLVRAREPRVALRLARRPGLPLDAETRLHLLPFVHVDETLGWLDHLEAEGLEVARAARWREALGGTAAGGGA